jgi:hypothetical protein
MYQRATVLLVLSAAGFVVSPAAAQEPPPVPTPVANARQALAEAGVRAPLTLLPARVLGSPSANVAEVLGLVLERFGMADLQVAEAAFDAGDAAWDAVPALLAAHVRAASPTSGPRWWLYAEYLGDPRSGPSEVRFVVVDATGQLALCDRQTAADAAFARTAARDPDPLGCSALVGERLFELAGWKKVPGGVRDGKFAERWRTKSGAPDKTERAAMDQRLAALRADLAQARIAVLPSLVMAKPDAKSAERVAARIGKELGCQTVVRAEAALPAVAPSSNQQKRLWGLAAALRKAAGAHKIEADYALVADLGVRPEGGAQFVNFVLCTKSGEVVIADFQNDQHPTFKGRQPKSVEDAEALVAARLAALLR